jgi:hypothetical protein
LKHKFGYAVWVNFFNNENAKKPVIFPGTTMDDLLLQNEHLKPNGRHEAPRHRKADLLPEVRPIRKKGLAIHGIVLQKKWPAKSSQQGGPLLHHRPHDADPHENKPHCR